MGFIVVLGLAIVIASPWRLTDPVPAPQELGFPGSRHRGFHGEKGVCCARGEGQHGVDTVGEIPAVMLWVPKENKQSRKTR